MNEDKIYQRLLSAIRAAYSAHPALPAFTPLPDNLPRQPLDPEHRPCSTELQTETGLQSSGFAELQEQIIASAPFMKWRQIYGNDQQNKFMDRLGCYAIRDIHLPFFPSGIFKACIQILSYLRQAFRLRNIGKLLR